MGHYYNGMLDIASDTTLQCATFGGHIEIIEVEELASLRHEVTENEIAARIAHFREQFDVQDDYPEEELARSARTSVALDRLVERHQLGSMAYYHMGAGRVDNEETISSIIVGN